MNRKEFLVVTRNTLKEYSKDDLALLAAGLTYYAFFSLFPLLLLAVTVASFVFKQSDAETYIFNNVAKVAPGSELPTMLGDIIKKTYESRNNAGLLLFVGIGTLAFSASNAF